ncbi:hypothetical protein [Leifsonia sp. Leaf264]|uniref:hypothetical protein n=1 Tax=Leifsonia sp. Leaf264 TaxID=1736314 RepID=UPI0006F70E37|nr:hypothetical protein [Leifsonia sp. Leaf264]KQO96817.1 hypothetical protein ASF30_17175 [Leifsonia sp. Leaf264]
MSERISIDFDRIQQHATRVGSVAADVRNAKDAAGSMNLGGGAFGLMCGFLVAPASMITGVAGSMIGSAGALVERSAREIRGVGADFTALENHIREEIEPLLSAVDQVR